MTNMARQYARGEIVVYELAGEYRTGRIESDERDVGIIVDDADTARRHIVARDQVQRETDEVRVKREQLGYFAQDLSPRMFQPFDPEAFARFCADPKRQALVKRILEDDAS
jgi:hypothetical protein